MTEGSLDDARAVVAGAYDRPYSTTKQLYGVANDEDDFGAAVDERVDPPFQQLNPRRRTRPSNLTPLTHQDDNGFAGLDSPLN